MLALLLFFVASAGLGNPASAQAAPATTPIRHVFIIVLENEAYEFTFGPKTLAPYLAHDLVQRGALLTHYYGIGHNSLGNYVALISGQAPNAATQEDCPDFVDFAATDGKPDGNGQLAGQGCIYPASVKTVADQLHDAGFAWKGYMEGMGSTPSREPTRCGHVAPGTRDSTNQETIGDRYADKHNPFIYFHSIIDDRAYCDQHVVPLKDLAVDLKQVHTTPNLSFITPDLCHDGHDAPCLNGEKGGLISADAFLKAWVPRIMTSPAFRQDGMIIVTFDEGTDANACCGELALPGGPAPGKYGPGGGRIGAVLISPSIKPGTVSSTPYNHYSTLRSLEQWFGLGFLGYAAHPGLRTFGHDVFNLPDRLDSGTANASTPAPSR
ncbi:phosphoesterase [Dyella japonica A8]|uniref:Phosphoesterase n=1 Tax=Dyella japonica A8 TaxID=1217721 RepID=A0A075K272_9GAMM|nr:phosphoesterase [Dyella japonica A8]